MKRTSFLLMLIFLSSCNNATLDPERSKAYDMKEQVKLLRQQNAIMDSQTVQLKRIADALTNKK